MNDWPTKWYRVNDRKDDSTSVGDHRHDDDLKAIAAILAPLLKQATQSPISQEDEKREARFRASRHAHLRGAEAAGG